jgi:Sporulation and spore germination
MASRRARRPLLAAVAALFAALGAAGCVSMPSGGPVQSYPVTQATDAQDQPNVQIVPQPPGAGWSPEQIVQGFLTASASFGTHRKVALQYLTPQESVAWDPSWSAIVYSKGPDVEDTAAASAPAKNATTVTVQITGQEQASLRESGSYSLTSASAPDESPAARQSFQLVKLGGQWRISDAPPELLLTSDSFANDYELRNLYFFDPTGRYLVPDPVYVPLRAGADAGLLDGLAHDLVSPPADWLSGGATETALPVGTKVSGVTLDGVTAVVNLTGTITSASTEVKQDISSQLWWTLSGAAPSGTSGQDVQSVEVEVNGHPWDPPGSQDNPVQTGSKMNPASGATPVFYYVDSQGYLTRRSGAQGKPARVEQIGAGYSQVTVAVSPDGRYLAALRDGTLYTGLVGGALARRGTGYVAMSWDVNDDLWASAGDQIVMFRGAATSRRPLGQQVAVDVVSSDGIRDESVPFTALRVAPDGVRVAIVTDGNTLTFGAISGIQGANPQIALSQVQLSSQNATTFTGVTWYGPDDVITLADPGPVATEYPVSGGSATSIPVDPEQTSISASSGNLLIAGLTGGRMAADDSLTGSWMLLGSGSSPAYPG